MQTVSESRRLYHRPEYFFLIVALTTGLLFCALIPPLGGGNETFALQRAASIAFGYLRIQDAYLPSGIVAFMHEGDSFFREGMKIPFSFSAAELHAMATIPIGTDTALISPNAIAVHHPMSYFPQAIAIRLSAVLHFSPLTIFYLARLSGLVTAIFLTFHAIRRMPSHGWVLCAFALLPTTVFSRSTLDADQITNAFAFFFIATTLREIVRKDPIHLKNIFALAVTAFIAAQCKNVYLFLPLLAIAIPRVRLNSGMQRVISLLLIALPGFIGSVTWLALVRHDFALHSSPTYTIAAGTVDIVQQSSFVLHHPLSYLVILLKTLFGTPFFAKILIDIFGVFGPPLTLPALVIFILIVLFAAIVASDRSLIAHYGKVTRYLTGLIIGVFFCISLTALYVQWTPLGADHVSGFQGRYLLPLLPLLLIMSKPVNSCHSETVCILTALFSVIGIGAMIFTSTYAYYA